MILLFFLGVFSNVPDGDMLPLCRFATSSGFKVSVFLLMQIFLVLFIAAPKSSSFNCANGRGGFDLFFSKLADVLGE